jgi:hypothetical protein
MIMAEEKPVHEQVDELTASWNPPPEDKAFERIVGVPVVAGDTRATGHTPMEELNSHMNPGDDSVDAQRQYADDADEGDEGAGDEDTYEDMNVPELKDVLKRRDLPVSGTKQELIDRLREDDEGAGDE